MEMDLHHCKQLGSADQLRRLTRKQEGLATIVIAIAAYFFVVNYPDTAKFITEKERRFIQGRLAEDSDATRDEKFSWTYVVQAMKDPKCWLYGLAFHTMSLPLYTLSLFLPSIIAALGYTAARAQLLTVPPYALATIFTVAWAYLSERYKKRAPFAIASSTLAIIGYIILMTNKHPTKRPGVSYLGTFFAAAGIYPSTALALAWPANNVSGQTKRAVVGAMQISIGNLGAVLGTQLYRPKTAPRYLLGHGFALGYLVANIAITTLIWWYLERENKKREATGARAGIKNFAEEEDWQGDDDPRWRFST
jgi:preprotein translocase subunit Sec61beta